MNVMLGTLAGVCLSLWTAFVVLVTILLSAPDPSPVRLDFGEVRIMDDARPTVHCAMYLDERDWC